MITDRLVNAWTKDRPPRIGDWQEAARSIAHFENLDAPRAITSPAPDPDERARVVSVIAAARAVAAQASAQAKSKERAR